MSRAAPGGWRPSPALRPLLLPVSFAYAAVVGLRNRYYNDNAHVRRASIPVVSVGNITVGGTGKTPFVIELVRRLQQMSRRPAIVTRGYGARAGAAPDEVIEFQQALPGVTTIINPDRHAGALDAAAAGCDIAVLDDGFQHRRLYRDLDVVLIDALDPWGGGYVLPAGRLREPAGGLRRADLVVITRANQSIASEVAEIRERVAKHAPDAPVLTSNVAVAGVTGLAGDPADAETLRGRKSFAICGLGNPKSFYDLVAAAGATVLGVRSFPDHYAYAAADIDPIVAAARRVGADAVLCTRKDWVKLAPLLQKSRGDVEWLRVDLGVTIDDPQNHLGAALAGLPRAGI
jgi:tetraacyldisaccharide 4'-kinase